MNKPKKYFRICYIDYDKSIKPLETHQFSSIDNNWFDAESEAEQFIEEHFYDSDQDNSRHVDLTLLVLPVYIQCPRSFLS
jgi:hypothetical protein